MKRKRKMFGCARAQAIGPHASLAARFSYIYMYIYII